MILKLIILINIFVSMMFYSKGKLIADDNFRALRCDSKNYIFNIKNGYLYFYDQKDNIFKAIGNRYESGFYSERTTEINSRIKNNKLFITNIKYFGPSKVNFIQINHIINLRSLIKKTSYIDRKKRYHSYKVKCNWVNPKS